jgi:hypothetical protein
MLVLKLFSLTAQWQMMALNAGQNIKSDNPIGMPPFISKNLK